MIQLLKYKKQIGILISVLGLVIGFGTYHSNAVKDLKVDVEKRVEQEIEKEHNEAMRKALEKYNQEINDKVTEYNLALVQAQKDRDNYWENFYNNKIVEAEQRHKEEINALRITNNADKITNDNVLHPTTLQLLNEARSIVKRPAKTGN